MIMLQRQIAGLSAAILLSCNTAMGQPGAGSVLKDIMPAGWECLNTPSSLVHPGQVYRRDSKTGATIPVDDLADAVKPFSGVVAPIAENSREHVSASVLVKFLNLAGLHAGGDRIYNASIELIDRSETDTYDRPVTIALRKYIDPKSMLAGWSYYIVRATQQAKRMTITVDRAIDADVGGEAQFKKLFKVSDAAFSAQIGGMTGTSYTIDTRSAGTPLTFCILAQRFDAKYVFGGIGGSTVDVTLNQEYDTPNANR